MVLEPHTSRRNTFASMFWCERALRVQKHFHTTKPNFKAGQKDCCHRVGQEAINCTIGDIVNICRAFSPWRHLWCCTQLYSQKVKVVVWKINTRALQREVQILHTFSQPRICPRKLLVERSVSGNKKNCWMEPPQFWILFRTLFWNLFEAYRK